MLFGIVLGFSFFLKTSTIDLNTTTSLRRSSSGRIDQWSNTLDITKNYPFFGFGSRNYPLMHNVYRTEHPDDIFTGRVNSSYVQVLTEKNLLGLLSYVILFIVFLIYSHKKIISTKDNNKKLAHIIILSSLIAIMVRELFFSSVFYNPGLFFLILILFLINTDGSPKIVKIQGKGLVIVFVCILVFFAYFIKANIKFEKEKRQLHILTEFLNEKKFNQALEYIKDIHIYSSNNSLLVSTCGLVYERNAIDLTMPNYSLLKNKHINLNLMLNSKKCYIRAIKLNLFEDILYHNIAWLYFYEENIDSALININQAINLLSNSSLYYVTNGMFLERINPSQSFASYKEAIKLSPDIVDSPFFDELKHRKDNTSEPLINNAIRELRSYQLSDYSTIIQARIGKLLLDKGETDSAKYVFKGVLNELANLNRPWFYQGKIYEMQDSVKEMLDCYKKANFLDFGDYLPRVQLAKYYWNKGDTINAKYYEETSFNYFGSYGTESSNKSMRKYFQLVAKDDLIPLGLHQYIMPSLGN